MSCEFCEKADFSELLDDLCNDDEVISVFSKKKVLEVREEGYKKIKVFASEDNTSTIEFEATFPVPKSVRSDIRRSYGEMFVNAFNSGDLALLFGFLDTFLAPNAKRISRISVKSCVDNSHLNLQRGAVEIAKSLYKQLLMSPDSVLGITNIRVVSNVETDVTIILSRFSLKATKILGEAKLDNCHKNDGKTHSDSLCRTICQICTHFFNREHSVSNMLAVDSVEGLQLDQVDCLEKIKQIRQSVDELLRTAALRVDPIHLQANGNLAFFVDKHMRISKLEMTIDV